MFSLLQRKTLNGASFKTKDQLRDAIEAFIRNHYERVKSGANLPPPILFSISAGPLQHRGDPFAAMPTGLIHFATSRTLTDILPVRVEGSSMHSILALSVFLVLLGITTYAAPCVVGTAEEYKALGSVGCTIGEFTFSSFKPNPGTPTVQHYYEQIPASQVTFVPSLVTPKTIRFDMAFGNFTSARQYVTFQMLFNVVGPSIGGRSEGVGDASVTYGEIIDTDLDLVGVLGLSCVICNSSNQAIRPIATGSTISHSNPFYPLGNEFLFGVQSIHNSDIQTNDPGDIVTFDSAYMQFNFDVPEPSSGVLCGLAVGSLGIVATRRRRVRSSGPPDQ